MAGFSIRDAGPLGRGVFADADVPADTGLWRDPVVLFPLAETAALEATALRDYYFVIDGAAFICLGVGTLVNHSNDANSDCDFDEERRELAFKSLRPIRAGEQITFNYGWNEYPWEAPADGTASAPGGA